MVFRSACSHGSYLFEVRSNGVKNKNRQTYRPRGHRWLVNVDQHNVVEFKPEEPTADGQLRQSATVAITGVEATNQLMRFAILLVATVLMTPGAIAQTCKSFNSCEEAVRSYRSGNSRLDRDKDGVPCESLCGKNGERMR